MVVCFCRFLKIFLSQKKQLLRLVQGKLTKTVVPSFFLNQTPADGGVDGLLALNFGFPKQSKHFLLLPRL